MVFLHIPIALFSMQTTVHEQLNQTRPHEIVREDVVHSFLDYVGNHEAKMLTAGIIFEQPDEQFTATDISKELLERQGDDPLWPDVKRSVGLGYCQRSLLPGNYVTSSMIPGLRGHEVEAFQAAEQGRETTLALVGAMLQWSLDHPDVSVQELLATTSSRREERSPQTRYKLYRTLLDASEDMTMLDVCTALGATEERDFHRVKLHLYALRNAGFITIEEKKRDYSPLFKVNPRDPTHQEPQLRRTSAGVKAVYEVLDAHAGEIVSLDDLVSKVMATHPEVDPVETRHKIIRSVYGRNRSGFASLEALESQSMAERRFTAIRLNEDARPVIQSFHDVIEDVRQGDRLGYYTEQALVILNDEDLFAQLMGKATNASAYYAVAHEDNAVQDARILQLLQHAGALTTRSIVLQLNQETDQNPLTESRVIYRLQSLVRRGQLIAGARRVHAQKTAKLIHYALPVEQGASHNGSTSTT